MTEHAVLEAVVAAEYNEVYHWALKKVNWQ
jgi:hypothetical protein